MSRHLRTMAALLAACVPPLLVAGCASAPPAPTPKRARPDEWIHNPLKGIEPAQRDKVFVAVGVSADKHNIQMTRRTAEGDARNKLAETIVVQVDAMLKDWMATATDYVKPENSASKQFTESVSRQVTSMTILGSTPRQYYDAPDGYTYVLMTAPRDDAFYRTMIEQTRKRLQAMAPLERKQLLKTEPDKAVDSLKQHLQQAKQKKPKPERPKPQPAKAKPVEIAPTAAAGPVPAWLQTGKHPDFPDSAYILGIGTRGGRGSDDP